MSLFFSSSSFGKSMPVVNIHVHDESRGISRTIRSPENILLRYSVHLMVSEDANGVAFLSSALRRGGFWIPHQRGVVIRRLKQNKQVKNVKFLIFWHGFFREQNTLFPSNFEQVGEKTQMSELSGIVEIDSAVSLFEIFTGCHKNAALNCV